MNQIDHHHELRGWYRDVLRAADTTVLRDSGWRSNSIVGDCRRLLAAFVRGNPQTTGVAGLQVGSAADAWDTSGTPQPTPAQSALVDPHPFTVPAASLQIDFLDGGSVTAGPTNRIQIHARLGPNVPPFPWPNHSSGNLREFGLVGQLEGRPVLINYVTHPVIAKDPASTLERTIWLQF